MTCLEYFLESELDQELTQLKQPLTNVYSKELDEFTHISCLRVHKFLNSKSKLLKFVATRIRFLHATHRASILTNNEPTIVDTGAHNAEPDLEEWVDYER